MVPLAKGLASLCYQKRKNFVIFCTFKMCLETSLDILPTSIVRKIMHLPIFKVLSIKSYLQSPTYLYSNYAPTHMHLPILWTYLYAPTYMHLHILWTYLYAPNYMHLPICTYLYAPTYMHLPISTYLYYAPTYMHLPIFLPICKYLVADIETLN